MNEQFDRKQDSVYSKRLKAGKRRTYFFDVRATRGNDYFLTITESRKRMTDDGYDRHKIFLYKEDFHKFLKGLNEAVDYVKTELMPDFNFDAFNHDTVEESDAPTEMPAIQKPVIAADLLGNDGVEKQANIDSFIGKDTIAHQDIIDGSERPGFDNLESKPVTEEKTTPGTHTEEVDRW